MVEPREADSGERKKGRKEGRVNPKKARSEGLGSKKEFILYGAITIAFGVLFLFLLQDTNQAVAVTIFLATILGTLMFWKFRLGIAFVGLVLLLLTGTIDLPTAIESMELDVILFLVGMMVIVGLLKRADFFRWLLAQSLRLSRFEPIWLLIILLTLAGLMAVLVDEVTAILFISALVLELCDHFALNPVKYIVAVVLATNIGSSWTVVGNPIGILIAFRSGLTFEDFLSTALPVGFISLLFLIGIVLLWFRKDFSELRKEFRIQASAGGPRDQAADAGVSFFDSWIKIRDWKLFIGSVVVFVLVVISLVLDHRLELWLELKPNTILFATPILGAGIVMLWRRSEARGFIQKDVDWWTLVFFMFLFAKAGALQYVGITDTLATSMLNLARSTNAHIPVISLLWFSGLVSGIADNVVVVAGLAPVAETLAMELGTSAPWWALLFGGSYGGNLTMIGSTANIVALGALESKTGHIISIGYWFKIGLLASVIPMAIGTGALLLFG